jgi:hypothetical protein
MGAFMLRVRLGAVLALSILTSVATAQDRPAEAHYDRVPPAVRAWIDVEQKLLSRAVDKRRIISPEINLQDERYAPESGNVFEVKSYWVDSDKLDAFPGAGLPDELRDELVRTEDGKTQVRFLVHPESESFYRKLVKNAEPAESFWATPTSSSRTLLVWLPGHEGSPFFAKLSLNKEIGGVVRTIPRSEVTRSVGINNVLNAESRSAPESFRFIPEVWSAMPKGMERGGMIIRAIPPELLSGEVRYVPLFSLYARPADGSPPLLARMIAKSGLDPVKFIREKIVAPMVDQWFDMVVGRGVQMEPHAQNVLIELGPDGLPTGRFLHRDLGGFTVDFNYRDKIGIERPRDLPVIADFDKEYHLDRAVERLGDLRVYFLGGFVYNLDKEVPRWIANGWVKAKRLKKSVFTDLFETAVHEQLKLRTGEDVETETDDELVQATERARELHEESVRLLAEAARANDTTATSGLPPELAGELERMAHARLTPGEISALLSRTRGTDDADRDGFTRILDDRIRDRANDRDRNPVR